MRINRFARQGIWIISVAVFMMAVAFRLDGLHAEEITVFGNESKPPKIWKAKTGPQGILVDILKAMENDLGVTFIIKTYPWKRTYTAASHGEGAIVGISKTDERLTLFDFSEPLYYDEAILVVKKGQEFPFRTFPDLRGKVIGMYSGSSFGLEYEKGKAFFKVEEDFSDGLRLKKVLAGRIDAAAISPGRVALDKIFQRHPELAPDDFAVLPKPLVRDPNYLAFSKKLQRQGFLMRFNRVLHQKMRNGHIQRIIGRH